MSTASALSSGQAVLYTKNGSVIKGTILELIPEKSVKIQTADGSIFVYTMTEVERIVHDQKPDNLMPASESQKPNDGVSSLNTSPTNGRVQIFAGLSLPVGALAETFGPTAGAAKLGFAVGADVNVALGAVASWTSSVALTMNTMDLNSGIQATGVSSEAGSWTSVWTLTGIKIFGNVSPNTVLFGMGQVGVLFGSTPELKLSTSSGGRATQNSTSASAFGLRLGGGFTYKNFSLTANYLSSSPEYDVTATGTYGTVSGTYTQPTSVVVITGGINF